MPEAGSVIGGKYRLDRPIGEGAMASVWSATHETLGRPVAVKFIHAQAKASEVTTARFMREAKIAAAIQHRYVVDIFDFGETDAGEPYMVMERLDGESLADRITRGPAIPAKTFVRMMEDCLTGLDAVHAAGIVHRDLKPENIFVIQDGDQSYPKLLDFGISRVDDSLAGERATRLTREGAVIGTPWYMSPEQIRGRADLDHRTDLYAIAVILYEVLSGALPFDSDTIGDLMVRIATEEPVPLTALRPDLPEALGAVIAKGMAKDPRDRYQVAKMMRIALRKARHALADDAFTVVMKATPSEPPEELRSGDLIVRPRIPSEAPPPGPATPAASVASRPLAPTEVADVSEEPSSDRSTDARRGGRRRAWMVPMAAGVLLIGGLGVGLALREPEEPTGAGSEPAEIVAPPEAPSPGETTETAEPPPEVDMAPEPSPLRGDEEPEKPEDAEEADEPTPVPMRRRPRRAPRMERTPLHFDDPGF